MTVRNPTRTSVLQAILVDPTDPRWDEFFSFCRSRIIAIARRLGLPYHDACEVAGDVAVDIPKLLRKYERPRARFRTYLAAATHHYVARFRNRRRRQILHEQQLTAPLLAELAHDLSGGGGLPSVADDEEDREQVWARWQPHLAGHFTEKTREACRRVWVKNRPVSEVARDFGMREATLYVHLSNLRKRLRGLGLHRPG